MKYFIDLEFMELPGTIEPLSLAIVAEDGREFYAEVSNAAFAEANEFVRERVIPNLWGYQEKKWDEFCGKRGRGGLMRFQDVSRKVLEFIGPDTDPVFWGYYCAYDWVGFCWFFGAMIDLPKGWPMYCRDIKQLCDGMGNPRLPKSPETHNALDDARWASRALYFLEGLAYARQSFADDKDAES
jgi:hypothetical protein